MNKEFWGKDFRYQSFKNRDLSKTIFMNCCFSGCDLTNCNLSDSDLSFCDFTNADLTNANLAKSKLHNTLCNGTIFKNTNLTGVDLSNAYTEKALHLRMRNGATMKSGYILIFEDTISHVMKLRSGDIQNSNDGLLTIIDISNDRPVIYNNDEWKKWILENFMSKETSYYFGAYIQIKVNKTLEKKHHQLKCDKGHVLEDKEVYFELSQYMFCSNCGSSVHEIEYTALEYPVDIDDIDDIDEINGLNEHLSNITPPSLFNTGVIIAISNCNNFRWLHLDSYTDNSTYQMLDFPTETDILEMKKKFGIELESLGIFHKLATSPYVNSVKIKAGYVLDTEY